MSRIEQIRELLEKDPDDVFLNFSLAMELVARGSRDEALAGYDRVLELDGDYVTAYYRKADLLIEARRDDEARRTLRAGIEAAERANDEHMKAKMTEMLARLR